MSASISHPSAQSLVGGASVRGIVARLRLPLALLLVSSLGACAVHLPRLPQQVPATWQHMPDRSDGAAEAPDLRSWWKAFNDADLDRLVDRALAENLNVQQAGLRIRAARMLAGTAHTRYLPSIGAHTYSEPTPDSSASYFQLGFDAKWELTLFGRGESHARVAAANLGIAESEAQAARVSVIAELVRHYIELRAAQQRLELLEAMAKRTAAKTTLEETRERLHLASASDVAQARVAQASAEAAVYEPRLAIDTSLLQLAVLLGQDRVDESLRAASPPPQLGVLRIASAPADLLRTRPEIRHAENEVLKAAGELGLARADRYPRIGLGGSLTYSAKVIGRSRLSDADGIVTFGPVIDMPLFDWGMRKALAEARDVELEASLLAYRQAVLQGVAESETAMATLEHQRERAQAQSRTIEALEKADQVTSTLRGLGMADELDRIASATALLQARLEAAQMQQERSVAFISLYKALGGAPLPAVEPVAGGHGTRGTHATETATEPSH